MLRADIPALVLAGGLGVRLAQDGRVSALEGDLLPTALAAGKPIYGLECAGRIVDIGTPENYRRAAQLIA